ncbi:MAG: DNA helicase, partial [Desulfobulbaceae bacterium]|nr:DNA helicase [Desulfobulbaceae bacterium]
MTINPKQYIVIIKGKDQTDQILRISQEAERMVVTYKSGKSYRYGIENVQWLSNPQRIATENCRVSVDGNLLTGIEEVLHFKNWVKVFLSSGDTRCCVFSELSVQRMKSSDGRNTDVLAYFRELAETSG